MNLPQTCIALTGAITWALVVTSYSSQVWAQSAKRTNSIPSSGRDIQLSQQAMQEEPDFSGDGRPGRREGGGSRSPCLPMNPPLTALMPVTNWGKTVAERPTFWFYVPYSAQAVHSGEFVLQDEADNDVYRTPFTLPRTPGFVSLSLPSTQAPLEINKWYHWYFKLYCEPQKLSAPVFVEGWVQRSRLIPVIESRLKAVTLREKYLAYSSNSIWYDAINSLAELRLTHTSDVTLDNDWVNQLRAIGLERLRQEPMIGSILLGDKVKPQNQGL